MFIHEDALSFYDKGLFKRLWMKIRGKRVVGADFSDGMDSTVIFTAYNYRNRIYVVDTRYYPNANFTRIVP